MPSANSIQKIHLLILLSLFLISCNPEQSISNYTTWSTYLGDPGRSHYSTLSQITPTNLDQLKIAWVYEAPDHGQMQMNPIVVDSVVYGVTSALRVFALHAATGKELWQFGDTLKAWHSTSRGVAYWQKDRDKRIFYTKGAELIALNAITGKPIRTFGNNGIIDLHTGLPASAKDKFIISNTPGTIFKDLIIMPTRVSESAGAAPGDIMAFDVFTGKPKWVFKTIPEAGTPESNSWGDPNPRENGIIGGANSWAGMAVDIENEIIYVPTGSAAPDFDGSARLGTNLFANCLLALNANTGELKWYFQFTHHDLWDRDPPAPPNLLNVRRNGKTVQAVAQITKQGYVFVFNRLTGEPLFDIEEISVPSSTLEGESAWPTQPIPVKPKAFTRFAKDIDDDDISPFADNREELKSLLAKTDRREYAPPSLEPVLLLPGYDGGAEWGGAAVDPDAGILYVNSNEMAWILQMNVKEPIASNMPLGAQVYSKYCVVCHQKDLSGIPQSGYPPLQNLSARLTKAQSLEIINNGKGMMTGFPQLTENEKEALIQFLFKEETAVHTVDESNQTIDGYQSKFEHSGYQKFLDSNGLPAITPPWGTLHAIDLNTGEYNWSVTLGDTPFLKAEGLHPTGCENYGGPIVTENGLLFIAGTKDGYFRIFNKYTGALLWENKLPAASFATPAMYEYQGKQYIVLACGGEKLGTPAGNKIIAFALE
ncbi:MAG: PQQ-binding-like beta-propeller repeat protein [Croceitalea sp.]|nr:PQQ-binding-like beta-propeller repeat protein [Croceitalea sp.]